MLTFKTVGLAHIFHADKRHAQQCHTVKNDGTCTECIEAEEIEAEIIKSGTGKLLETLFQIMDSKLSGSSAASVAQGYNTEASAAAIIANVPYEPLYTNTESNLERERDVAAMRLFTCLEKDFPGLRLGEHISDEIPLHCGNYVPSLRYSNVLYSTCVTIYRLWRLRPKNYILPRELEALLDCYRVACWHLNGLLTLNPNSIQYLFSEFLPCDTFLYNNFVGIVTEKLKKLRVQDGVDS